MAQVLWHTGRNASFLSAREDIIMTHADGSCWGRLLPLFVCVSVCLFLHNISENDAARITKLDIAMFDNESWKPMYFGVKVTSRKHCWFGSLHSCECWRLLVIFVRRTVERCLCRCKGLMILETFTTLTGDELLLPSFLEISKEVTGDPAYSMYYLSLNDPRVPTTKPATAVITNGYHDDDVDYNCNM